MSRECISFINHCLTYNAQKRPSWEELKNHKFIKYGRQKRQSSDSSAKIVEKDHSNKRSGSRGRSPVVPESLISTS
jgi:serine/threonine protein kinase